MTKDTVFVALFWVAVIGGVSYCGWNARQSNARREQIEEQQKEEVDEEFTRWCAANSAVPAFKGLPKKDLLTIDLQRSLSVHNKRVAFRTQLADLYRSEKRRTMMAAFAVDHNDAKIYVYLKCTENQAQALHEIYQKSKDATLLIAAEFEGVEPTPPPHPEESDSESATDYKEAYGAIGTLINCEIGKPVDTTTEDAKSDGD